MIETTVIVVDKNGRVLAKGGAEFVEDQEGETVYVAVPAHLVPVVRAIAARQQTTPEVVIAQAIRDYCEGGV